MMKAPWKTRLPMPISFTLISEKTAHPLPLPDGVEDALEGLRLQHDVLHKVVRQVAQVNLADALGELHLNHNGKTAAFYAYT